MGLVSDSWLEGSTGSIKKRELIFCEDCRYFYTTIFGNYACKPLVTRQNSIHKRSTEIEKQNPYECNSHNNCSFFVSKSEVKHLEGALSKPEYKILEGALSEVE